MLGSLFSSLDTSFFDDVRRLESDMEQLRARHARPADIRSMPRGTFPPVNVGAAPERVDVYLFAAGIDPSRIDVTIQQNVLTISGTRSVPVVRNADYYRRERFEGEFRRTITLPEDVDPDRVDAKYRDGVLHVTVQRREASRPRQIEVH